MSGEEKNVAYTLSKHMIGLGMDYSKNGFIIGLYLKWDSKYTDYARGSGKHHSYVESNLRVAYTFKMPFMKMKKRDAEFEVVANDIFGSRAVEATSQYVRQPDVYAGLKIKF